LRTDVNVPTVRKKQNNFFFVGFLKAYDEKSRYRICSQWYESKDPDPDQNLTDLEHWVFLCFSVR
jgi:hypothetical protein